MSKKRKNIVKTFAVLLAVIVVVTIGWSTLSGQMYEYKSSEVAKEVDHLPFDTKIPTKVPFKEMSVWESNSEGEQQVVVGLSNVDKESLDIRITNNSIEYPNDLERKNVRIGKDIEGVFIPADSNKRILSWQDDGIHYEITYFSKITPMEVSKKQLVKMAESFE